VRYESALMAVGFGRASDGQHEPWMPEYPAWKLSAACATSTANFYPTRGESSRPAKAVCAECPVRQDCLDYAMANDEHYGIWGGLSEKERRRFRSGRNPGPQPTVDFPAFAAEADRLDAAGHRPDERNRILAGRHDITVAAVRGYLSTAKRAAS
jgi:hypothetical protein